MIQHQGEKNPHFITPHKLNFRGEKLSNLIKFKRFNNLAYKLYKNSADWKGVSIENWYNQIPLPLEYKKRIVYPFLAASLGTSVSEIKSTSALDIVKLFAFRKPKLSNKFKIMTEGMGTLIQQVGVELRKQGVKIKTESPVYQITKQGTKWLVKYVHNATEHSQLVDFVITTAHADQNIKLLNNEPSLSQVVYHLQQLKYFEAKIVLHSDTSFINTKKPAFLNIMTNQKHEIASSTMNLSMISPRLNGIYKSWLSQNDIDKLNASKKILHIASFYHPLITPEFISHLDTLHQHLKKVSNFYIGGGWSEGLETQNSAVVSGKHALDKYKIFIGGTYAIKE
ncbi:MAG: hypothetical protein KF706_06600 [Chitinophagales bacterium]|nr:hypothetical protein [Chitinophagales bacterium]